MGFCACTSKFVLFFFNLICALLGLAVLGIGTYSYIQTHNIGTTDLHINSIIVIVFGGLVFLVSFFGCWGAISENRCLLNTYAVIMTILLLILIAIGAVVVATKGKILETVNKTMGETFSKAEGGDQKSLSIVEGIQYSAKCCGYQDSFEWTIKFQKIPPSCCGKEPGSGQSCGITEVYSAGCEDKVADLLKSVTHLMGIFAITVGCVELLGVVFAFILAHSIRRQELRSYS